MDAVMINKKLKNFDFSDSKNIKMYLIELLKQYGDYDDVGYTLIDKKLNNFISYFVNIFDKSVFYDKLHNIKYTDINIEDGELFFNNKKCEYPKRLYLYYDAQDDILELVDTDCEIHIEL